MNLSRYLLHDFHDHGSTSDIALMTKLQAVDQVALPNIGNVHNIHMDMDAHYTYKM